MSELRQRKQQKQEQSINSPSSVRNSRPRANSGLGRAWPHSQEAWTNRVGELWQGGGQLFPQTQVEKHQLPQLGSALGPRVKAVRAKLPLLGKKTELTLERFEPAPPKRSQPILERIVLWLGREAVTSRRPRLSARLIFPLQLLEVAGVEPRPRKVPKNLGVLSLPQHQRAHAGRYSV